MSSLFHTDRTICIYYRKNNKIFYSIGIQIPKVALSYPIWCTALRSNMSLQKWFGIIFYCVYLRIVFWIFCIRKTGSIKLIYYWHTDFIWCSGSVRLEFGRSRVLIHPRPSNTKGFNNGTNCFSVWCSTCKGVRVR